MGYMVALSLYMPPSPCALVIVRKDMDYTCLKLRQVCIFKILCFRVIFTGCCVSGQYDRCVRVFRDFRLLGFLYCLFWGMEAWI